MEEIIKKYSLLNYLNVSRETCLDFEMFISMILKKNREINIISRNTMQNDEIRKRHIVDSAQAFDFVDFNGNTTSDLGTGGGMPGIIIAIMMKNANKRMKLNLYEKSHHKGIFLKEVSRNLKLETEVIQKDVFETTKLSSGTIMARAFKPMPTILDLVFKNFSTYKNLILFMGERGKDTLKDAMKDWDFDYKEKKSITNENSFLLNIKNIKKKKLN